MKKKCILFINASKRDKTAISLERDGVRKEKDVFSPIHTSQYVLPLTEEICKECGIVLSEITDIHIHTGPGSFTGLRVGATIGTTLGWLLNIPVNGKKGGAPPLLDYGIDHWKSVMH